MRNRYDLDRTVRNVWKELARFPSPFHLQFLLHLRATTITYFSLAGHNPFCFPSGLCFSNILNATVYRESHQVCFKRRPTAGKREEGRTLTEIFRELPWDGHGWLIKTFLSFPSFSFFFLSFLFFSFFNALKYHSDGRVNNARSPCASFHAVNANPSHIRSALFSLFSFSFFFFCIAETLRLRVASTSKPRFRKSELGNNFDDHLYLRKWIEKKFKFWEIGGIW